MAAHEVREDRYGREDAAASDEREPGAARQLQVLADRTISGVLVLGGGPAQPPAQQELDARLQVREIPHRQQQLSAGPQDATQLREAAPLLLAGQVLQHLTTERAIE